MWAMRQERTWLSLGKIHTLLSERELVFCSNNKLIRTKHEMFLLPERSSTAAATMTKIDFPMGAVIASESRRWPGTRRALVSRSLRPPLAPFSSLLWPPNAGRFERWPHKTDVARTSGQRRSRDSSDEANKDKQKRTMTPAT